MTSKKTDRNDCIGIFNRPPAALARHIDSDKQNLMVRLLILPMEQDHSSGVKQQMNKMMNLKTGRSSHFQLKCVGKQNNNNLKTTKNQSEQDRALSPNTFKRMGCIGARAHTHTQVQGHWSKPSHLFPFHSGHPRCHSLLQEGKTVSERGWEAELQLRLQTRFSFKGFQGRKHSGCIWRGTDNVMLRWRADGD